MPTVRRPVRMPDLLPHEMRIRGLRVDHERIYEALNRERRRRNLRFNQVAEILGVHPATLCCWGYGVGLSANHLARALAWLDLPLAGFVTPEPAEPRLP